MNLGLKRFTLRYLLLEVAWIAIALGTLRFCWVYPRSDEFEIRLYLSEIACCGATGAMLGGFFGRMVLGAIVALVVPVCIVIFLFGNYVIYLIEGPASQNSLESNFRLTHYPQFGSDILPVSLVYQELQRTLRAAVRRERQLKRWSHAKKAALIAGDLQELKALSKRRT